MKMNVDMYIYLEIWELTWHRIDSGYRKRWHEEVGKIPEKKKNMTTYLGFSSSAVIIDNIIESTRIMFQDEN